MRDHPGGYQALQLLQPSGAQPLQSRIWRLCAGQITQRSHLLRVPPMTAKEAEATLGVMRAQFERDYGLTVNPDAAKQAAGLAARYISAEALPGAAVRVLQSATSPR